MYGMYGMYGMVWYGMVCMVWYGMVCMVYGMVWYGMYGMYVCICMVCMQLSIFFNVLLVKRAIMGINLI